MEMETAIFAGEEDFSSTKYDRLSVKRCQQKRARFCFVKKQFRIGRPNFSISQFSFGRREGSCMEACNCAFNYHFLNLLCPVTFSKTRKFFFSSSRNFKIKLVQIHSLQLDRNLQRLHKVEFGFIDTEWLCYQQ